MVSVLGWRGPCGWVVVKIETLLVRNWVGHLQLSLGTGSPTGIQSSAFGQGTQLLGFGSQLGSPEGTIVPTYPYIEGCSGFFVGLYQ